MDHCVGDGAYNSLVGGEEMTDDSIWSLRRANGVSVLTVRIENNHLNYARGYNNHAPGRGASLQVRHLVAAFEAAGTMLSVCPSTQIVAVPDGRTFREDRIPPDIRAALDEAERERREARERRTQEGVRREYVIPYGQIMFRPLEIRTPEDPLRPILGDADPFRVVSMTEALGYTSEPRTGVTAYPQVLTRDYHQIRTDGGRVHGIEVAAATAEGADLVAGEDYMVDQGLGIIRFTRDLRDVEVLWQQVETHSGWAEMLGRDHLYVRLETERASVRARRAGLAGRVLTELSGRLQAAMPSMAVFTADTQSPIP